MSNVDAVVLAPARLEALRRTGLLDTPPEETFDRYVELARSLLGAPAAVISLVDAERHFFKSCIGAPDAICATRSLPLGRVSFCQQVVGTGEALAIGNALESPLGRDNEAVEALGVRAYLGVPLTTREGHTLGTLSVLDVVARTWRSEDVSTLRVLAAAILAEIELRSSHSEVVRRSDDVERARREKEAILHRITDMFFALDRDFRWVYLNAHAQAFFELLLARGPQQLVGRCIWDVLPMFVGSTFYNEYHRAIAEQVSVTFEEYCPPTDKWLEVRAFPDETGLSVFFRDITARREAQAKNHMLLEKLRAHDRRKDEFLAMLGHELRNPLAPLSTALQMLRRRPDDAKSVTRLAEVGERQVRRLARLVDDLLDVARITQGKIALARRPVDLVAIVSAAVEATAPLAAAAGHRVRWNAPDAPLFVEGDADRLEQVVCNLLHNAVKYTPSGGRIDVDVEADVERVTVSVRDDGVGIAKEALDDVFELFVQAAPSLERAQGGLGIGLTLVRSIVTMHGGTVEARSDGPGRGSTFVVQLPRCAVVADPARHSSVVRTTLARRRFLVVDDNVDAASTLAAALAAEGHEVHVAHDGPGALAAARERTPDVILLDIGLPGMSGYDVASALRVDPATRSCFIVALTGYGADEDRRRARDAGFDVHFVKPIDLGTLESVLAAS